jgi:hypothetical protein
MIFDLSLIVGISDVIKYFYPHRLSSVVSSFIASNTDDDSDTLSSKKGLQKALTGALAGEGASTPHPLDWKITLLFLWDS